MSCSKNEVRDKFKLVEPGEGFEPSYSGLQPLA